MDAAQRLLKNSAILAATALLMATVGLAQPTLNVATSVTMDGTGGQDVSVTSSGSTTTENPNAQQAPPVANTTTSASAITISMTASVTGSVTNWLSNSTLATNTISSSGGTTLTIVANSSNLATGSYQGTVTITPSTGLPLNITVNFTVGSTVGNGTWYATPGSVAWNFTSNSGSYPSQAV